MGVCCQKTYNSILDEYLLRSLNDLNLWNVTYEELLSILKKMSNATNRLKLASLKEHKLFKNLTELQNSIMNTIFIELADDTVNLYKLIFYLLPFLSYYKDGGSYFYDVCFYQNQNIELKIRDYEYFLKKYFKFALITTTNIVKAHVESKNDIPNKDEIIKELEYRLEKIWTEENINKEILNFTKTLDELKNFNSTSIIEATNINLVFKNTEVRTHYLSKYQYLS